MTESPSDDSGSNASACARTIDELSFALAEKDRALAARAAEHACLLDDHRRAQGDLAALSLAQAQFTATRDLLDVNRLGIGDRDRRAMGVT